MMASQEMSKQNDTGLHFKRPMNRLLILLGGRPALEKAVQMFYAGVLEEPTLARFFKDKDTRFISRHFADVIEACYGEDRTLTASFSNKLGPAHAGLVAQMGLSHGDYDRMMCVLESTLDELKLSPELKTEMLDLAEHFRAAVLPPITPESPACPTKI